MIPSQRCWGLSLDLTGAHLASRSQCCCYCSAAQQSTAVVCATAQSAVKSMSWGSTAPMAATMPRMIFARVRHASLSAPPLRENAPSLSIHFVLFCQPNRSSKGPKSRCAETRQVYPVPSSHLDFTSTRLMAGRGEQAGAFDRGNDILRQSIFAARKLRIWVF